MPAFTLHAVAHVAGVLGFIVTYLSITQLSTKAGNHLKWWQHRYHILMSLCMATVQIILVLDALDYDSPWVLIALWVLYICEALLLTALELNPRIKQRRRS